MTLLVIFSFSVLLSLGSGYGEVGVASERMFADDHASYIGLQGGSVESAGRDEACKQRIDSRQNTFAQKLRHAGGKKSRLQTVAETVSLLLLQQDSFAAAGVLPVLPEVRNGFYRSASGLSPPFRPENRA